MVDMVCDDDNEPESRDVKVGEAVSGEAAVVNVAAAFDVRGPPAAFSSREPSSLRNEEGVVLSAVSVR